MNIFNMPKFMQFAIKSIPLAVGVFSSCVMANSDDLKNIDEHSEPLIYTGEEITTSEKKALNKAMLDLITDTTDVVLLSSGWIKMNTNGTKWYSAAANGVTAFHRSGQGDKSVEYFYTPSGSNPFGWISAPPTYLNLQGSGNRSHICPDSFIIDYLYYEDSGDDSVERLRCYKINKPTVNHLNIVLNNNSETWCPSGAYLTGVTYKDTGDDYITQMRCSEIYQ